MVRIGRSYTAKNQGMCITPQEVKCRVVAINADTIWYKIWPKHQVYQTTLARFCEIVGEKYDDSSK